jgi:oxygen-independent coproporphyrinogen-3 oxidase
MNEAAPRSGGPSVAGPEPVRPEPATGLLDLEATDIGSVFVSNYPPYSAWNEAAVPEAFAALDRAPGTDTSLGLYIHIPFCRKRCKFCYFRVYIDKNHEQIGRYLDALGVELERYAERAAVRGRNLDFVYFGGGTPSYIAAKQLIPLAERLQGVIPWNTAEEVAFECEPGTLTQSKLEAIRSIGVTRLSLGVENFDDGILQENGRAHVSKEIYRVRDWIRQQDFRQLNVDLIAGMVGETWESWKRTVDLTIEYDPDSITLYQMELPFNTVYSKAKLRGEEDVPPFADWRTKREWHAYAFEQFERAGFERWSAYTMMRRDRGCKFVYAREVWSGADMIPIGVSSFGHMGGVHMQNHDRWDGYLAAVDAGGLATRRALVTTERERLTREVILQLKRGWLERGAFERKFGVDVVEDYAEAFGSLTEQGLATVGPDRVDLSAGGILRVDQLLPRFYDEQYRGARYT